MLNKCCFSKGKIIGFSFKKLNEDPVREITICHLPQREGNEPGDPSVNFRTRIQ